ncbi:MAG: DUF4837 family protein [Anditalea sp.]
MPFKNILILATFLFPTVFMAGCGENGGNSNSNKPQARGGIGEILLVIDSLKYQGPVGDALKGIFEEDIRGLEREEKIFNLKRIDPRDMNRVLKLVPNIVYVTTFDDASPGSRTINAQFNQTSKEKAQKDSSLFMLRNENEFAQGQEVLYLFGANEEQLIKNLDANKAILQNFFEVRERKRLARGLLSRKNSAIKNKGLEKFGIGINVPASYQFVQEDEDFLWLRQPTPTPARPDISMFFFQTDYISEEQLFPENIIKLRNELTRDRIFGDPANENSYIEIQKQSIPSFRDFTIDGRYAIELRSQWRTHNISMGGSFLSYTVVDEESGKLYYMEGFVYYPNEIHRTSLREIETILLATDFSPSQPVADD